MDLRRRCRAARRYVLKADPSRQWRLLDLQAIDTRLDQIAHATKNLPQRAQLAELEKRAAALDSDLVRAQTALGDIQREVAKADTDVQLVRDRAARNRARLDAGTGTAKDLQALQHELDSLNRRQGELEEVEIEIMERAEGAEADVSRFEAARTALAAELRSATEAKDDALKDFEVEAAQVAAPRADTVAGVGADLAALYEKIRTQTGGLAAAALRQRRCGGCQLELNNVEMSRIKAAPDDEVLRCEECRRILVRTSESGL